MKPSTISGVTLFTILTVTCGCIDAQSDSAHASFKKNEIGINIGPVALVMLGAEPYTQAHGLTYKRVFGKWALRSNFTFLPPFNFMAETYRERTPLNDSTYTLKTTYNRNRSYTGRIGLEYRNTFKNGWAFVIGGDVQGRYTTDNRYITNNVFKIDSIKGRGTADQILFATNKEQSKLLEEKTTKTLFGASLTVGLIVPFSKHWCAQAHYRVDALVGPQKKTTSDFVAGKTSQSRNSVFDFSSGAAISELSLYYRF